MTQGKFAKLFILFGMITFTILNTSCNQHTHSFMIKTNDEQHYHECECGKTKDSALHTFELKKDEEQHYYECECGKIKDSVLHTFELKKDEEQHYYECECGSIKEESEHKFSWIIDQNPTIEEEGIKHQECEVCNLKKDENTPIAKLGKPVIKDNIPMPLNSLSFEGVEEFEEFMMQLDDNSKWLYLSEINKSNEFINVYQLSYEFNFDEKTNNEYANPYISIAFSLYSDCLGTDTKENIDALYHSISFMFDLRSINEIEELRYEFYEYDNEKYMYNNLIYIYSGDNLIGKAYYYTVLNVSEEWLSQFLNENISIIK